MKTLVRTNSNFFPSVPSLFNDLLADDWFNSSLANWRSEGNTLPSVNVKETNDEFIVEVAAPGMKRQDFKIELDNHVLTVSSEREDNQQEQDKAGNYTRREFSYQSFQRSFALPKDHVEGEKIAARYADGILYINVPKSDRAKVKPARQIQIS
jgi:HSP20 family protein